MNCEIIDTYRSSNEALMSSLICCFLEEVLPAHVGLQPHSDTGVYSLCQLSNSV